MGEGISNNYDFWYKLSKRFNDQGIKDVIDQLEVIVNKKIPEAMGDWMSAEIREMYAEFLKEYEKFKNFIFYDTLMSKNIKWNGTDYAVRFNLFFRACIRYCKDTLARDKVQLEDLKRSKALTNSYVVAACMEDNIREIEKRLPQLKAGIEVWPRLQVEFFSKVKYVSEAAGIKLPRLSDLENVSGQKSMIAQVVAEYVKQHGVWVAGDYVQLLQKSFSEVIPVFDELPGGSGYTRRLAEVLKRRLNERKSETKLNEICLNDSGYLNILEIYFNCGDKNEGV